MKKFTKLFLSCAAVAAVTAAVATSAMAAEMTLSAKYNEPTDETAATTTVTITCDSEDEVQTLLILKPSYDKTSVKVADILQIDQKDSSITTATIPVLDENNDDEKGTYTVLVGGTSGNIYAGTFSIGGEEITIGDVNGDGDVKANDANAILWSTVSKDADKIKNVGKTINLSDGTTKLVGDVNGDNDIKANDANAALWYTVSKDADKIKEVGTVVVGTIVDTPAAE